MTEIKELRNAAIKDDAGIVIVENEVSIRVKIPAPVIAGIASKNENFAASFPDIPNANPMMIVIPDRDIPGMIAIA